jgi:hypothetical protein
MRVYHYLEAEWALDNIKRRRLKLSKIDDMNDPWEWKCVRSDDKASQVALEMTAQDTCENSGVLCFGQSWTNLLMWSHYGEKHKGICLGFDVPDDKIRVVKYVRNLEVIGRLDDLPTSERERILNKLIEVKSADWCYEKEVRMHGGREEKDEETGMYFVPFGDEFRLKEVIAGIRFPMSRRVIEDALKGYPEDVKIAKAARALDRFEIIINERGFDLPSTAKTFPSST